MSEILNRSVESEIMKSAETMAKYGKHPAEQAIFSLSLISAKHLRVGEASGHRPYTIQALR
jgi:hypothetical protein